MPRSEGAHVTYLLVEVTMESAAANVNIADIMVHGTQIAALMHAVNATPQQRYAFVRNGQTLADALTEPLKPAVPFVVPTEPSPSSIEGSKTPKAVKP